MTYLLRRLLFLVAALLPVALPYIPALAQTTETLIFIHTDIAGSVIGQTNAAGNLFWRENYRPYGERTVNSPSAAGNREFFHGKAFDVDTELNYVGARYYDPVVGRFMGVDAVGFDERNIHSFNRFAYGNNNPYKFVDPDGRAPFLILFAPVIASVGGAVIAGSLSAGIQYGTTGTIQWGGIGGVLDAMGEGATLGLLGVSAFGQARTAVVAGATIGVGRTAAFDIAREGG
jgi:RHS repeat-associated protein